MKKVFENEEIIVYSDKRYLSNDGRWLKFEDGSQLDLYDYTIINYGNGEINVVYLPQKPNKELLSRKMMVDSFKSINYSGGNVNIKIINDDIDNEYIVVRGTEAFFEGLKIEVTQDVLNIYTKPNQDSVIIGEVWIDGKRRKPDPDPLYAEIIISKSIVESLKVNSNGKGNVCSETPIGILQTQISGAFSMKLSEVDEANIHISGSGNVIIAKLLNDSEFTISGSGEVSILNGDINKLFADISGSGSINAMVSANEAYLNLSGSGRIIVNNVKKFSQEKKSGSGGIKILHRGLQE